MTDLHELARRYARPHAYEQDPTRRQRIDLADTRKIYFGRYGRYRRLPWFGFVLIVLLALVWVFMPLSMCGCSPQ